MDQRTAHRIASSIVEGLSPNCNEICIAGSLRRKKPEVYDIDIVCARNMIPTLDMFGEQIGSRPDLDVFALGDVVVSGDRYRKILLPQNIYLDLYLVHPLAEWGVILAVRTGSLEFVREMASRAKRMRTPLKDGHFVDGPSCPNEIDFFNHLGIGWLDPERREIDWRKYAKSI